MPTTVSGKGNIALHKGESLTSGVFPVVEGEREKKTSKGVNTVYQVVIGAKGEREGGG